MQPLNRSALLSDIRMTPAAKYACPANSAHSRISQTSNAALNFGVAIVVFAWDRYQLPIQSGNAALAAVGITCLWDRLAPASGPLPKMARA